MDRDSSFPTFFPRFCFVRSQLIRRYFQCDVWTQHQEEQALSVRDKAAKDSRDIVSSSLFGQFARNPIRTSTSSPLTPHKLKITSQCLT